MAARSDKRSLYAAVAVAFCMIVRTAMGQPPAQGPTLTFDENGHGSTGPGTFTNDPGPGGLQHVLTYSLPFAGVQGDVALVDSSDSGAVLDVVRFNGDGTLIFYSDNIDGFDSIADTPGPPQPYTNVVRIPEVGPEGANQAIYTPTAGQPGFDPSGPTYVLISDAPVAGAPTVSGLGLWAVAAALLASGAILAQRRSRVG